MRGWESETMGAWKSESPRVWGRESWEPGSLGAWDHVSFRVWDGVEVKPERQRESVSQRITSMPWLAGRRYEVRISMLKTLAIERLARTRLSGGMDRASSGELWRHRATAIIYIWDPDLWGPGDASAGLLPRERTDYPPSPRQTGVSARGAGCRPSRLGPGNCT